MGAPPLRRTRPRRDRGRARRMSLRPRRGSARRGAAPGAWPFLGHVVALHRRPLALLDSLPAHGDLVEVRFGPRPAYVVCHSGMARQVLTDLRGFDRTGLAYERVRTAMRNGLASAATAARWNLSPDPGTPSLPSPPIGPLK